MKKLNTTKVRELINNQVSKTLNQVSESPKKETKKKSTKKLVPIEESKKEEPSQEEKPQKKTSKKSQKEQVIKEVEKQQKPSLVEKVISQREVKYIYPEDVNTPLARKKWRQQVRNKLKDLEIKMNRLREGNKKEFEQAKKAFEAYQSSVLKSA